MEALGIVEEMGGKKRDKVYIYSTYLNLLEEGAPPFNEKSMFFWMTSTSVRP